MNKEEILNMPAGYEMRELLATSIMGWKPIEFESEFSKGRVIKGWFDEVRKTTHRDDMWFPDENIEDAYIVLFQLAKEPFAWHIESANLKDGSIVWWVCLWGDMPDGSIAEFSAQAESIPLAVSRVALLKGSGV